MKRLAVAGRYQDRHSILAMLEKADLSTIPAVLTASWLTGTAENDAALTDAVAYGQVATNLAEIKQADALLYFTCHTSIGGYPFWSPGRLIDFGIALASNVPIIVVGKPEPTIYQRGQLVTVCTIKTLRETVKTVMGER